MVAAFSYRLQGNAAAYFECTDEEVLNESGARTGKTHVELLKAYDTAMRYPGARLLFARETRKALTETVLPDWETKILGRGHPAIGKARRNNRDAYHFSNGSTVVLHGLDDPENVLSGEFDRFWVFQAEQLSSSDPWDALMSRLSGNNTPYCQGTADANPGPERHWLIKRARSSICENPTCGQVNDRNATVCRECGSMNLGRMRHFEFRHTDNPLWFDWGKKTWTERAHSYIGGKLGRLRGVRRKRLLLHQWVSEEGQVLEDWDPAVHRIAGKLEQDRSGKWILLVSAPGWSVGSKDPMREARVALEWFGAGADFGFMPHPGCLQVWGYDRHGRRFRVREVYKTQQQLDWWAMVASQLYAEFKMLYIAVDPSAPAMKDAFNRRIALDHGAPAIAIGADNTIRRQEPDLAGIDLLRWGLRDQHGVVRTFFLKDALLYGSDPALREASLPTCTEEEIPEWVFERQKSTDKLLERPDRQCPDHGCDSMRYEAGEGWGVRSAATLGGRPKYPEGSAGEIHRHEEKMAKARAWREEHG